MTERLQIADAILKRITGKEEIPARILRSSLDRNETVVDEEWDFAKALLLTSTSSADDILWLLPFAIHEDRFKFCSCYLAVRTSLTVVAAAGGKLFQQADKAMPNIHASKVLSGIVVAITAVFAWFLFVQWRRELRIRQLASMPYSDGAPAEASSDNFRGSCDQRDKNCGGLQSLDVYKVVTMTLLASLDNETMYVAALGDQLVTTPSLLLSQLFVSLAIIFICASMGYFRW
eukprot:CAMPEP_0197631414 /NCGR_PEP_ID=MMETSP1338-20131121/8579_1 /TAXON_ID=43686 ORGANISM="Pelagodinium beii, Strain RCC1491" /NCGR_SAMPLE_ID=MMETSP1338 /ASSEMBLY_ACC=CAM_ASM_000754 /LENGTH=231 /DNA_ID=CAMNT_0043202847 /DNA_START=190 /DNA_END=882 /DNA_ORIENTATION=+